MQCSLADYATKSFALLSGRLRTASLLTAKHSSTRCLARSGPELWSCRSFHNDTFQEGDILCIKRTKAVVDEQPLLTGPLKLRETPYEQVRYAFNCRHGVIKHQDLVGRRARDVVSTNTGHKMIVSWPTLEEYIILSKRTTAPIYPGDAQCIIGLLDLHVTAPTATSTTTSTTPAAAASSSASDQATPSGASDPAAPSEASDQAVPVESSNSAAPSEASDQPAPIESPFEAGSADFSSTLPSTDPSSAPTSPSSSSFTEGAESAGLDTAPETEMDVKATMEPGSSATTSTSAGDEVTSSTSSSSITTTPSSPSVTEEYSPMEILEVGTGHGSLTLHLARAIHASVNSATNVPGTILHTVDVELSTSNAAKKLLKGFRRGMYYTPESVKFYSEGCGPWLIRELEARSGVKLPLDAVDGERNGGSNSKSEMKKYHIDHRAYRHPFLHAALVDLPFSEPYLPLLAACLHQGAFLGFFAPSITQLVRLITYSKANNFPFFFERTVEFPNSINEMGGNLREWDIRRLKMNKQGKGHVRDLKSAAAVTAEETSESDTKGETDQKKALVVPNLLEIEDDWMTVCRPLVGGKVKAGGFYTVARRMADI